MKYAAILGTKKDDMIGEVVFENLELAMSFFGGVVVNGQDSNPQIDRASVVDENGRILCAYDITGVPITLPSSHLPSKS